MSNDLRNKIAIALIKEYGKIHKWSTEEQLIIISEFVSSINLDDKLELFLDKKILSPSNCY